MASGCSSGETLSEPKPAAGDLATAISQGTVTEEMLERCAQEGSIDVPNKDGETPLMLACLKGLEDVVTFLLANGANPNYKSSKEGYTPLHYACMLLLEDKPKFASNQKRLLELQKLKKPKLSIVKLLLNYGASVQKNIDGWSPVCVAAFYLLNDCVDFFLSMGGDDIPLEDKIKASELLGVLQATLTPWYVNDAFYSFCRAINLQEGAGVNEGKVQTSELVALFSKISLKEFHKLEEIRPVESSESALKAHAILVSEKLFPPSLKQSYFFPSLAYFAFRVMFHEEKVERGFQIFCYALDSERCGEALPGTVLQQLSFAYHFHLVSYSMGEEEPQPLKRQLTRDLMSAYVTIFKNVHIDCLLDVCHSLMQRFSVILFSEAMDYSSRNILKSTLQDIENLLSVIRSRILRERPDEYNKMPSLTFEIMTLVRKDEGVLFNCETFSRLWFLVKIRYMLLRVLLSDNASYQDRSSGNTLLHMLAYSTFPATWFGCVKSVMRCIRDLARAFIRHGCSLEAVNDEGQTARDILHEFDLKKKPNFKLIESLLSPPTTVLQLQETAVRVVLRHKINYQDILPLRLHEMMERVTDSDLKLKVLRKFDNGSSEENSDSNDSSDSSEENSDSGDSENSSESTEGSE